MDTQTATMQTTGTQTVGTQTTSARPAASPTGRGADDREMETHPPPGARAGALAMLTLLTAYVPFAFVIGSVAARQASPVAGWAGSWLIYGGSAHLAAMRTL